MLVLLVLRDTHISVHSFPLLFCFLRLLSFRERRGVREEEDALPTVLGL